MSNEGAYLVWFKVVLQKEPVKQYKAARALVNLNSAKKRVYETDSSAYIECGVPDGFAKRLVDGLLKLGIHADVIKEGDAIV